MSGVIWTRFFWSDWESDPALRLCSYAAQGLWMRMLCIAAAHDPIGYVAVAGRALSEEDLARMTGGSPNEVSALLGELERNGVFSRDRLKRIYSRRMTRDARKAAVSVLNRKKGGNPNLSNNKDISASVNPHFPVPIPNPENSKKDCSPTLPGVGDPIARPKTKTRVPDDFPTTAAKLAAVEYWRKRGREDLCQKVEDQADQFHDYHTSNGTKALDWPATWRTWVRNALEFNRAPAGPYPRFGVVSGGADDFVNTNEGGWVARLQIFHFGNPEDGVAAGFWPPKYGPPPGRPGCRVTEGAFQAFERRHGRVLPGRAAK